MTPFAPCCIAFRLAAMAVVAALLPSVACAQHNDVVPYSNGNGTKILIGGHSDSEDTTGTLVSVFGYDFGETETTANYASDPGFNNGSAFTTLFPNVGKIPSGNLELSIFSGAYGSLHYWAGTGTASFAPVTGVEIDFANNGFNLRVGGTTNSGSLIIAPIPTSGLSAGRVHTHLESSIWTVASGTGTLTLGAPNGIYAVGATLSSGGLSSDPIYFVFNQGMTETIHDDGIAFYSTQVVPEPSCFALLALGVAVLAFRRKRHR